MSFWNSKPLVGMVHVRALPGTPNHQLPLAEIVEKAFEEARTYQRLGIPALLIENMHDVPYLKKQVGPEIVASLTLVARAVRSLGLPCGIQVLAGANQAALAIAQAAGLEFIRAEGFAFGHLADEGWFDSDAAELLRYRKLLDARDVRVVADIKKKHASHAATADLAIEEVAQACQFMQADAVVVTGAATAQPILADELRRVRQAVSLPVWCGSGITSGNLGQYFDHADAFVVGSFFKKDGNWKNELDPQRVMALVGQWNSLRDRQARES